ncbi:MAG: cobalt ECF transporter T component CbiQ [Bacteroidales bacterium]|nr:cobalt ECF transporter T component CbiQ [Bacteroidales bacterium]
MAKLEKALLALNEFGRSRKSDISPVAAVIVTLFYIVIVLTVPVSNPQRLVWIAVYPVMMAEYCGAGFVRIFIKSLWVLPFVILIGIFNPIFDHNPGIKIAEVNVSAGWISFISIILRGLLSMQSLIILGYMAGFLDICSSLRRIHIPRILVTQLLLSYRYLSVLIEEALSMRRARQARGFGSDKLSLSLWAALVGQLLVRSADRASTIHRAMLARGFDGELPLIDRGQSPDKNSILFAVSVCVAVALLRWLPFDSWFGFLNF